MEQQDPISSIVNNRQIGILSMPNYSYNDNIPSSYGANSRVLEEIQRRYSNRPTISQYTPKPGETARLEKSKKQQREAAGALLNKAAESKIAKNAMQNIVEPLLALEMAGGIWGGLTKKAAKSAMKNNLNDYASSITQDGVTRFFNKEGKELPFTIATRTAEEVRRANQALKGHFRTGSTNTPPEGLNPYLTD